ncbi:MAG TPA: septum formation initiator family protein [Firmicutes bacterium]|nr:septum formation initiator family protein [Bacillota bacterium]
MAVGRTRKKPAYGKIVLLLLIIWLGYAFGKGFMEHHRLRKEIARLTNEIQALELRNAQIREEIEYHRSEEYIEKVAREELGLVKPGETRFIITESSD